MIHCQTSSFPVRAAALGFSLGTALLLFRTQVVASAEQPAAPSHPNILFLLVDQWRAKAMSYEGDPNIQTPQLDRLARESVRFRNAVSVCPVCTPYRAALMTGRYPTSTGMFLNDAYLPASEVCLAEVLNEAGYATGYIGKWHLDGHGRGSFVAPERRQGWEYWKGAECDHNYNRSHYYTGNSDQQQYWEGYDVWAQTADAQAFLQRQARTGQPFALLVSLGPPHFPHETAPAEYQQLYPPERIQLPPNVPESLQQQARQEAQGYYAHCSAIDRSVGQLLDTLEETGLADHTILVFTSDHGEMLGSHGCRPKQKHSPWDEAARIPLLVRYPAARGREGRDVMTPLNTPDLTATLLGLAGVARPASMEGEDLSGLVTGQQPAADRAALYMGVAPFGGGTDLDPYRAIRTSRYTYARSLKGPWLLFDDQQDPWQMNNLVDKPEVAALRAQLDAQLSAALSKIGDDFRPAESYIRAWGYRIGPHGSVPYTAGAAVQSPRQQP